MPQKLAAIDLGSNSFRLLIAEVSEGKIHTLANELVTVRLGERLNSTGVLSDTAQERAMQTLAFFAAKIRSFGAMPVKACGTAALRKAANSEPFINRAGALLQTEITVLSEAEEADLAVQGALSGLPACSSSRCFVDAGGGSTEISFMLPASQSDGKILHTRQPLTLDTVVSIPIGAVNLTEQFFPRLPPSKAALRAITHSLETTLTEYLQPALTSLAAHAPFAVIGSGGTATALAAADLNLSTYDPLQIQGHILTRENLDRLHDTFCQIADANHRLAGLDQGRGEIILAGLKIFQTLLSILQTNHFTVSDSGLLEGILLSISAS